VNHTACAAQLRAAPGQWQRINEYNSSTAAKGIAREIQTGARRIVGDSPYQPPAAYEARTELTDYGHAVYARYVGRSDTASDTA
jgi:hypothetical protein